MFDGVGLLICGLAIGFVIAIICYAIGLATHKPDFEIDDVDSGVFDVRRYNRDDKHD